MPVTHELLGDDSYAMALARARLTGQSDPRPRILGFGHGAAPGMLSQIPSPQYLPTQDVGGFQMNWGDMLKHLIQMKMMGPGGFSGMFGRR